MSCQEEVPKKKARPLRRPAAPGSLRCSAATGGCGTRAYGPQTVLALFPLRLALLDDAEGKKENRSVINRQRYRFRSVCFVSPSWSAEQRSGAGRRCGRDFSLLSFGDPKERMPARQARNPAVESKLSQKSQPNPVPIVRSRCPISSATSAAPLAIGTVRMGFRHSASSRAGRRGEARSTSPSSRQRALVSSHSIRQSCSGQSSRRR